MTNAVINQKTFDDKIAEVEKILKQIERSNDIDDIKLYAEEISASISDLENAAADLDDIITDIDLHIVGIEFTGCGCERGINLNIDREDLYKSYELEGSYVS